MRIPEALYLHLPEVHTNLTATNQNTERPKILLVDDNEQIRTSLSAALGLNRFQVTTAANVGEALHLIDTASFDVLISDLHMPGAGDGLTVVSAMRHTNPAAITLVFTGFPAMKEAMQAILLQADEILVKPMLIPELSALIRLKLVERHKRSPKMNAERVASILERDSRVTIAHWLARVDRESASTDITLTDEERTGHLPKLLAELVERLRTPRELGTRHTSKGAALHGSVRQHQGYTVSMLVSESRILQVSIFETLQNNLSTVDFSSLLLDVMTVADEVDSQLEQTISSFMKAAGAIPTENAA